MATAAELKTYAEQTGHTLVTVECRCRLCKADAATLGLDFPGLRAEATEAFVAAVGKHHVVNIANDPQLEAHNRWVRAIR